MDGDRRQLERQNLEALSLGKIWRSNTQVVTIDERLEALTARREALTLNVEMMHAAQSYIHDNHEDTQKEFKILLRSRALMSESLDQRTRRVSESLNKLTSRMSESFEKLTSRMIELAEAQQQTDRRMDVLILTVDEIVRGRHGGSKS